MIITLKGADFSANNIGKVVVPRKLNEHTLKAISACGKQLTDEQKFALDDVFIAMGADGSNEVLYKTRRLYLPMIAGNLSKALINYADVNMVNDKENLNSSNWAIFNNGLQHIQSGDDAIVTLDDNLTNENCSFYWLRTTPVNSDMNNHNIMAIRADTSSNWLGVMHATNSIKTQSNPGSLGWAWATASNPLAYNSYDLPSDVVKTQMVNIDGENYQFRNIQKDYIGGCPTINTSINNADSQRLYVLSTNIGSSYGALMVGEYIEDNDLAFRIADSLDTLYAVMKS